MQGFSFFLALHDAVCCLAACVGVVVAVEYKAHAYLAGSALCDVTRVCPVGAGQVDEDGGKCQWIHVQLLIVQCLQLSVVFVNCSCPPQFAMKGRGAKTFKKWLDELVETLSHRSVAEIGISYAGTNEWANEMKAVLQPYVEKPISVLETGSIIQTHTGENAWAILIRYNS